MFKSETFNIDCLEYMKSCSDKQFSCIICDPPYSDAGEAGWTSKETGRFGPMFKKYHKDLSIQNNINHASGGKLFGKYGDECKHWDFAPPDEYWDQAFRISDYIVAWGGNYFSLPPSRNFIIWEKPVAENFSLAQMEYCWLNIPGNARIIKARSQDKYRFHPTQKPRILYDKIFEWYGDKYCKPKGILDPFLGSGSSRIAAWDAGIDFVGIELNEVYFQKQEARFAEHIAKGDLYGDAVQVIESEEGLF